MAQSRIIEFNLERYFPTVEQGIHLTNQEILRCRKQKNKGHQIDPWLWLQRGWRKVTSWDP